MTGQALHKMWCPLGLCYSRLTSGYMECAYTRAAELATKALAIMCYRPYGPFIQHRCSFGCIVKIDSGITRQHPGKPKGIACFFIVYLLKTPKAWFEQCTASRCALVHMSHQRSMFVAALLTACHPLYIITIETPLLCATLAQKIAPYSIHCFQSMEMYTILTKANRPTVLFTKVLCFLTWQVFIRCCKFLMFTSLS